MTQHDDRLDERLRAADPASTLPPADPAWVARLLGDTMGHDVQTESRETGTHNRSPLTWLVAAAAAVIILGAGIFAVINGVQGPDEPRTPAAGSDPGTSEPTVTELNAPGTEAYTARCAVPNARVLSGAAVAFDGTVDSISGGLVTLTPGHWYAGDETDAVTVEAPSDELQRLIMAVDFTEGGRYLVAADQDGNLMVCGYSSRYSDSLAKLYGEAFAG